MKRKIFPLLLGLLLLPFSRVFAAEEIILDITEDAYVDSIQFYDIVDQYGKLMLGFGDTTGNGITRVFLKYSNTPLLEKTIAPEQIESAILKMYQYRNKYGTNYEVMVGEPERYWEEFVLNWNTQPQIVNTQPQPQKITAELNWKEIDITEIIKRQILDPENSYGLALYSEDEFASGGSFWSTNCISSIMPPFCSSPLFPHIVITLKEDAKFELVSPKALEGIKEDSVTLHWSFNKEDELYMVEVSDDSNFTDILETSNWISEKSYTTKPLKNGKYYWRIKSYFSSLTSVHQSFILEKEHPAPKEEEKKEKEIEKKEPPKSEPVENKTAEVKGAVAPPQLQVQLGFCKYKRNLTTKEISRIRCKLEQPKVPRIEHVSTKEGVFWLDTEVTMPTHMKLFIKHTRCKSKTILDPATWFWCKEEVLETTEEIVEITGSIWAANQGKRLDAYRTKIEDGKYRVNFPLFEQLSGKRFQVVYSVHYSHQLDDGQWLEVFEFSPKSDSATVPKVEPSKSDTHPYRFPFEKIIGVTQWYGYTDYQKPHTGIDFGAKLEPVYAPADGKIIYAGWDNGKNKCLSGGNYVLIEHQRGKHTIFLHLKDYINENGKKWKVGDKIVKGQKIGTTGNTGIYNCEPLGYHLHFETRNSKSYSSHTNPVPLINIDWDKVPTLGYGTYPGRLSGENPHPTK